MSGDRGTVTVTLTNTATTPTVTIDGSAFDTNAIIQAVALKPLSAVLHQLDQKIIYPHYDFKHLTEKYFEIGMKLNDFSIQLVKY